MMHRCVSVSAFALLMTLHRAANGDHFCLPGRPSPRPQYSPIQDEDEMPFWERQKPLC